MNSSSSTFWSGSTSSTLVPSLNGSDANASGSSSHFQLGIGSLSLDNSSSQTRQEPAYTPLPLRLDSQRESGVHPVIIYSRPSGRTANIDLSNSDYTLLRGPISGESPDFVVVIICPDNSDLMGHLPTSRPSIKTIGIRQSVLARAPILANALRRQIWPVEMMQQLYFPQDPYDALVILKRYLSMNEYQFDYQRFKTYISHKQSGYKRIPLILRVLKLAVNLEIDTLAELAWKLLRDAEDTLVHYKIITICRIVFGVDNGFQKLYDLKKWSVRLISRDIRWLETKPAWHELLQNCAPILSDKWELLLTLRYRHNLEDVVRTHTMLNYYDELDEEANGTSLEYLHIMDRSQSYGVPEIYRPHIIDESDSEEDDIDTDFVRNLLEGEFTFSGPLAGRSGDHPPPHDDDSNNDNGDNMDGQDNEGWNDLQGNVNGEVLPHLSNDNKNEDNDADGLSTNGDDGSHGRANEVNDDQISAENNADNKNRHDHDNGDGVNDSQAILSNASNHLTFAAADTNVGDNHSHANNAVDGNALNEEDNDEAWNLRAILDLDRAFQVEHDRLLSASDPSVTARPNVTSTSLNPSGITLPQTAYQPSVQSPHNIVDPGERDVRQPKSSDSDNASQITVIQGPEARELGISPRLRRVTEQIAPRGVIYLPESFEPDVDNWPLGNLPLPPLDLAPLGTDGQEEADQLPPADSSHHSAKSHSARAITSHDKAFEHLPSGPLSLPATPFAGSRPFFQYEGSSSKARAVMGLDQPVGQLSGDGAPVSQQVGKRRHRFSLFGLNELR